MKVIARFTIFHISGWRRASVWVAAASPLLFRANGKKIEYFHRLTEQFGMHFGFHT